MSRCRRLDHGTFARPAAISRTPGNQHAEGGRHDIEPFRYILANLVECAATAGARLALDVHHLFDPLEMGGQRAAVGLAGMTTAVATGAVLDGNFGASQRYLDVFEGEVELLVIELFGATAKTMALECFYDRLEALDFGLRILERIDLAGLFEDERAQRVNIIGKVRFEAVNQ